VACGVSLEKTAPAAQIAKKNNAREKKQFS
jgi:hypothetical protein